MFSLKRGVKMNKPIFIIGCARSGTTALSAPLCFHPHVGPKPLSTEQIQLQEFLNNLHDYDRHIAFSEFLEQKTVWFEFFAQERPFADMGKELIIEKLTSLMWKKKKQLIRALTRGFVEDRFLSKAPTNSFRVLALKEMFNDAKFIAIHRNGCDVVNSWGSRPYGFAKMGFREGIEVFSRKWNETIDYLFSQTEKVEIYHIRYEELVSNPAETLSLIYDFCDLDKSKVSYQLLQFQKIESQWKQKIDEQYHELLLKRTYRNRVRLGYEPT
jgi:hypothetical protein